MAAVFNAPIAPVCDKNSFWVGLFGCSAGDDINDFQGRFTGSLVCGFPFNDKHLADIRKIEIIVEFSCNPNSTDFDPTMIRRIDQSEVGFLASLKMQ